jgi:DNA-binding IclR family transcriptional regulator
MPKPKQEEGRRQRVAIISFIREFKRKHGYMPTNADIVKGAGIPDATLRWHLHSLRDQGFVSWVDGARAQTFTLCGRHLRTLE